jgi:cobalt-zinc-cadmium efflux system outer membrane protein
MESQLHKPIFLTSLTSALLAILPGCSSAPNDAGFSDVQKAVGDRTGQTIQWNDRHTDDRLRDSVRQMLAGPLTADQAVQISLLNSHGLQAKFEDLGIAQADLVQAGLLKNPVFDLGVRFPTTPRSATYLDFSVAQDFLDIFFIPARKKIAAAQFEQVKSDVTAEVFRLAAQTRQAYYDYQAAEQGVDLRRTLAAASQASEDAASAIHRAGNSTDLELTAAQSQNARAKIDLADAEAEAADAREHLTDLLGLFSEDADLNVPPRLPDLPANEIQPEPLESLAMSQRWDLLAARQTVEVQSQALGLTSQTRLLTNTNLGIEAERETDNQWRIGPSLSVPVPLFDQGNAAVARARATLRQAEQRYWALAVDIRSEVRLARNRMFNARRKAQFYRDRVLPLEQQLVQQTQLQYNGMYVGIFQLLAARQEQIDAGRQYIESLRQYWIARCDLERAVGGRLPNAAATTQPSNQN